MTIAEHINGILARDPTLTDEKRSAIAELSGVAYQNITGRDFRQQVELDPAEGLETLPEIVEQLESCGYRCEAGPLENNTAFVALKRMAAKKI